MNNQKPPRSSTPVQYIRPINTIIKTPGEMNGKVGRPMYKNVSLTMLNYMAFLILFITSFVFIFQKNAAILGYALLFITNLTASL